MKTLKIVAGITLISMQLCSGKAIIWDLNFTLIKDSPWKAVKMIGFKNCMLFGLQHGSKSSDIMEKTLLEVLDTYEPLHVDNKKTDETPMDPKGKNHQPQLMQDWFAGKRTSAEIKKIALEQAEKYDKYKPNSPLINMFAKNNVHKKVIKGTINWMFTPEEFAKGQKVVEPARKLLKECATVRDASGALKHTCYLLSNCDAETYSSIENDPKFEPVFRYIAPDHRFISAKMKCIKPQQRIFECLLQDAHLDAKDCILIDDQEENCKKAKKLGIDAIEIIKDNYTNVKKELTKRGVFEP